VIREAAADEAPVLFGLAREEIGPGFSSEHTLDVLARSEVFVSEVEGVACGYVAVAAQADRAVVRQLFVAPAMQGAHVGHQLLDWVEGLAVARGLGRIEVESGPANERATIFYERRGYVREDESTLVRTLPTP
jgi:GNAT superfamily N-acetyltransferase